MASKSPKMNNSASPKKPARQGGHAGVNAQAPRKSSAPTKVQSAPMTSQSARTGYAPRPVGGAASSGSGNRVK